MQHLLPMVLQHRVQAQWIGCSLLLVLLGVVHAVAGLCGVLLSTAVSLLIYCLVLRAQQIPVLHKEPRSAGAVRCVVLSDTHNEHTALHVPPGDILIHCGDFSYRGTANELREFNKWLGTLPHKHKIIIAGNHELTLDGDFYKKQKHTRPQPFGLAAKALLTHATYLEHEALEVMSLRIFGSPFTPPIPGQRMAFNRERGSEMKHTWAEIPMGLDLLVTHGPPKGVLDMTFFGQHVGCEELRQRLAAMGSGAPSWHLFGHIHEARGVRLANSHNPTSFLNAACVSLMKTPRRDGAVVLDVLPRHQT
eukprot:g73918.t1